MKSLSVIVPSRDGEDILLRYLPGIIRETEICGGELIIVDDCSTDGTSRLVSREFPAVKLIRLEGEPAFCRAVNTGMQSARGDFLLLLNNDTIPGEGSFRALVDSLGNSESSVAVAVPSIPRPDGTDDSQFRCQFRRGLALTGQFETGQRYPSGACALWKKDAWLSLGGLDCRYAPIYWEDTDMGVRMAKMGYSMIICPEISVKHMHASTMGAEFQTRVLRERNRFIFMDANCSERSLRVQTGFWLPLHLLHAAVDGNRAFIEGYSAFREWRKHR